MGLGDNYEVPHDHASKSELYLRAKGNIRRGKGESGWMLCKQVPGVEGEWKHCQE